MKKVILYLFAIVSVSAYAQNPIEQVRNLAKSCVVVPVRDGLRGVELAGNPKIECEAIVVSGDTLLFRLPQHNYIASLEASAFADGDDLSNLILRDERGEIVARLDNIPSYKDILLALFAGHWEVYRQIRI